MNSQYADSSNLGQLPDRGRWSWTASFPGLRLHARLLSLAGKAGLKLKICTLTGRPMAATSTDRVRDKLAGKLKSWGLCNQWWYSSFWSSFVRTSQLCRRVVPRYMSYFSVLIRSSKIWSIDIHTTQFRDV